MAVKVEKCFICIPDKSNKSARTREQKKKAKELERDLADERARNVALADALERSLKENEKLKASARNNVERVDAPADAPEDPEIEFNAENGLSSTRRVAGPSFEESKFISTMTQLSNSFISIPECKPTVDGEIHRTTYELWMDSLKDSLKLAHIEDETTSFTIFKLKAGTRLLEIFRSTKSQADSPDEVKTPFSNALHRLQSYFGSSSDVLLLRRQLLTMRQEINETNLNYLTRVSSTARLCDYDDEKEFEQIVATISEHARNRDVRAASIRVLRRKGTYIDLVDEVREIETIRINEEYVKDRYGKAEQQQALIAPVQSFANRNDFSRQRYPGSFEPRGGMHQRGSYRGGVSGVQNRGGGFHTQMSRGQQFQPRQNRGGFVFSSSMKNCWRCGGGNHSTNECEFSSTSPQKNCWRCGGIYHPPNECKRKNDVCYKCGQRGHIQRMCNGQLKRAGENLMDAPPRKIAAIEVQGMSGEEPKLEEPVSVPTED